MADYIKPNNGTHCILFQAYVHIDQSFETITDDVNQLTNNLDDFLSLRAKHFLYPEVDVDLIFKSGSIKAYATVTGTLRRCLRENYVDFDKEIEHLFWFTKRLSDAAVMEVAFSTSAKLGAIEHTEARPGVIGQTKRIIDKIHAFKPADSERAAVALNKRVRGCKIDAERLLNRLGDAADVTLVKKELRNLLELAPRSLDKKFAEKLQLEYETSLNSFRNLLAA